MNTTQLYDRARIRLGAILDELHVNTDDVLTGMDLMDDGYMVQVARKSDGMILARELVAEEPE